MQKTILFFSFLLFLTLTLNSLIQDKNPKFDLVIKNGRIVDGAGNPWFKADVGIKNGKILKIGLQEHFGILRGRVLRGPGQAK